MKKILMLMLIIKINIKMKTLNNNKKKELNGMYRKEQAVYNVRVLSLMQDLCIDDNNIEQVHHELKWLQYVY